MIKIPDCDWDSEHIAETSYSDYLCASNCILPGAGEQISGISRQDNVLNNF